MLELDPPTPLRATAAALRSPTRRRPLEHAPARSLLTSEDEHAGILVSAFPTSAVKPLASVCGVLAPRQVSVQRTQEDDDMASHYGRQWNEGGRGADGGRARDDSGRFMDEERNSARFGSRFERDDDRGGQARGDQPRDRYGRFTEEDRGARYGSGRGDEMRPPRFRDDGYYDSRGDRSRWGGARDGDDYGDRGAGRGRAGGQERDEFGRFAGDGGGSRFGLGRDDDDGRAQGRGGWFGDPRGHAEAAREGWRERDDERGFARGRDEQGGRDDDDGRGHGRGGWFGDPQGHARAAREGWRDR